MATTSKRTSELVPGDVVLFSGSTSSPHFVPAMRDRVLSVETIPNPYDPELPTYKVHTMRTLEGEAQPERHAFFFAGAESVQTVEVS